MSYAPRNWGDVRQAARLRRRLMPDANVDWLSELMFTGISIAGTANFVMSRPRKGMRDRDARSGARGTRVPVSH